MKPHLKSLTLALASLTLGASAFGAEAAPVASEELSALANDVSLTAWTRVAANSGFTTIEESWVSVYSPKDPVGAARDWNSQLSRARALAARTSEPRQKRWLQLFIKAGEAVSRKDSARFAATVRTLEVEAAARGGVLAENGNILEAK